MSNLTHSSTPFQNSSVVVHSYRLKWKAVFNRTVRSQCPVIGRQRSRVLDLRDCAGITILLTLSVYQMIVSEKLPATSDAVPLMSIVLCFFRSRLCRGFMHNYCMQHAAIIASFRTIIAACCVQKMHAEIAHETTALLVRVHVVSFVSVHVDHLS